MAKARSAQTELAGKAALTESRIGKGSATRTEFGDMQPFALPQGLERRVDGLPAVCAGRSASHRSPWDHHRPFQTADPGESTSAPP